MGWTRIRLVHVETGRPIAADWVPTVRDEEITAANQSLQQRQLPWRWVPEHSFAMPCSDSTPPSSP